jgi:hypothetical protein
MKLKCPTGTAEVFVPDNLLAELKGEIGFVARENGRVQAMLELNNKTHIGLRESQAIVIHLIDKNGLSHRCKTQLGKGEEEEEDCPKCRSLKLNW